MSSKVILELDKGQESRVVDAIADNPKMQSLVVSGPLHGEWLRDLEKCDALESIELHSLHLSDSDVAHLTRLKSLRRIKIVGPTELTTKGTSALTKCLKVEELSLSQLPLSSEVIGDIGQMRNLRRLELFVLRRLEVSLQNLSHSKTIKSVELGIGEADSVDLDFLKGMVQIEEVSLSYFSGATLVLSALPICPMLRSVTLYEVSVDSSSYRSLSRQPSLKKLMLSEIQVDQGCIDGVAQCKALEVLRMSSVRSDMSLSWTPIRKLTNLHELRLTGVAIPDGDVEFLREHNCIRKLELPYCRGLTDKSVQRVAELCPSLVELNLDGTRISIDTLRRLLGLQRLCRLSVRNSLLNVNEVATEKKAHQRIVIEH